MSDASTGQSLVELRDDLLGRLAAVRKRMRGHFVAEGTARLLGWLVALLALTLLLDWWLELSLAARLCCWGVILAIVGWVLTRHLIGPLKLALSPIEVADALDRSPLKIKTESTQDQPLENQPPKTLLAPRVATVLQLSEQNDPNAISPPMIDRAVRAGHEALASVDFRSRLSGKHLTWSIAGIAVAILIPTLFTLVFPTPAKLWAQRWLLASDRPWPRSTMITVEGLRDGRLIVPRGEPANLQIHVVDEKQPTETVWMRLTGSDGESQTISLTKFAVGDFRHELPPMQSAVNVEMWGGDGRAEPFRIEPMDRPRIVDVELTAKHPRETTPQVHSFTTGAGNVRVLPGSQSQLRITTNVPVATSEVGREGAGVDALPVKFTRNEASQLSMDWTHTGEVRLRVVLTAEESGLQSYPQPLVIGVQEDNPPRVSARYRGVRQRVTPEAIIPLTVTARDDFGIGSVSVNVAIPTPAAKPPMDDEMPEEEAVDEKEVPDPSDSNGQTSDGTGEEPAEKVPPPSAHGPDSPRSPLPAARGSR